METTEKKNVRKERAKNGTRSQKSFTFRLDNDLSNWLDGKPNKGLYINSLIRSDMMRIVPQGVK